MSFSSSSSLYSVGGEGHGAGVHSYRSRGRERRKQPLLEDVGIEMLAPDLSEEELFDLSPADLASLGGDLGNAATAELLAKQNQAEAKTTP